MRVEALSACIALIESDQQFNQVAQLLGNLAELPSPKRNGGDPALFWSVFFKGFQRLSANQVVKFFELQLKNGGDPAVINTVSALDEWGDQFNNSEQELEDELRSKASNLIRLVNLRQKPLPHLLKDVAVRLESLGDQTNDVKAEDVAEKTLYNGKRLSEWLNVLEIDRDPQTQSEAVKACAALYASSGRDDELMTVLNSYLQRNTSNQQLYQGNDRAVCLSGFSDSLKTLPPEKIVEFFKLQLSQGDDSTISWTYKAMLINSGKDLFSIEIQSALEADADELLRLIAGLSNDKTVSYLFRFIVKDTIKGSVSNEAIDTIKEIVLRLCKQDAFGMIYVSC